MKVNVNHNIPEVQAALRRAADQVPFALAVSLNAVAEKARVNVRAEMSSVFDRPTPWVLNSLRVKRATKVLPEAELTFKDHWTSADFDASRSMIEPHIFTGKRHFKMMEVRLMRVGMMPPGYNAVPGAAAQLDGYGNMSKGQITTLLNVLGTYTEAGYNKANGKTIARLAKGNVKKNQYGFVYWVNKVGSVKAKHLMPGVYQRVNTGFGSSLKPVLIFVKRANYKKRLDMFGITQRTVDTVFVAEFNAAFEDALRTARFSSQGSLL